MQNSPARFVVEVGAVIDDTYTIEAMIGRGGMGAVYLASHTRLQGKKVAIKTLHAELGGEEILARFKREADIASQLDHPNIVKVENYNLLPDGTPYIVYEYLQGESLAQRIADGGAMSIESTFSILRQIGSALGAAHRAGIVHRDLKPQNIFLSPSEVDGRATELAKVLDFGISKLRGSTTVRTQESTLLGTPQYMAPEQATGQHSNLDQRTDIFALGAILYEMVSGKPAFSGANIPEVVFKVVYEEPRPLSEVAPNVAEALVLVIKKAMAKPPADRYATVAELVEAMTGTPLSLVRKPKLTASPPNPSDPFAQTLGSGDHGSIPPTIDAPPPVSGSARTVDSQSPGIPRPIDEVASASTLMQSAAPVVAPPAEQRRKGGLAVIIALAVILLGGVALYLARKHDEPQPPVTRIEPRQPVVVPTTPAVSIDAAPIDAAAVVVEAPKPDAGVAKVVPKKDKPATVVVTKAEEDDGGDETVKQRLQEAEAALHANEYDKAEHIANFIITGNVAGKNQLARAHVIHGLVMCSSAHNNQGAANTDARQIKEFPKLHARLFSGCHDLHVELSDD